MIEDHLYCLEAFKPLHSPRKRGPWKPQLQGVRLTQGLAVGLPDVPHSLEWAQGQPAWARMRAPPPVTLGELLFSLNVLICESWVISYPPPWVLAPTQGLHVHKARLAHRDTHCEFRAHGAVPSSSNPQHLAQLRDKIATMVKIRTGRMRCQKKALPEK